jgi:hypothetical protein
VALPWTAGAQLAASIRKGILAPKRMVPAAALRIDLSCSGDGLSLGNCIELMCCLGVECDVRPGFACKSGISEPSVVISLYKCSKSDVSDRIWPALRDAFTLECVHVKSTDGFSGCVYDYMRPSNCPKARRASCSEV